MKLLRTTGASRLPYTLATAAVVVVGAGVVWVSCGVARSPSPASSVVGSATSVTAPTAVPTLDFFRGRSYPTPTAQKAG